MTTFNTCRRSRDARRIRISAWSLVTCAGIALSGPAWSQATGAVDPAPAPAAEDDSQGVIVVTAERRSESILKTPLAVSAIGSNDLQVAHIGTLTALNGRLPGLNVPNNYAGTLSVYIRGIGTSDVGVSPAVGIYVDDVYIPRAFGNGLFDLPDLERVEVLRGPQGTLYGQNTTAGAIKLVSRTPKDELEGFVYAEIGNYGALRTQAYVTGPLVPGLLSASLAYTHHERNGYTYNAALDRHVDAIDTDMARLKLRFTPSADVEAVLSGDMTFDNSQNTTTVPFNYNYTDPRTTWGGTVGDLKRRVRGLAFHVTAKLSDTLTLKSISGYRYVRDVHSINELDGTPGLGFNYDQPLKDEQLSQELQLQSDYGAFTYTLGGIYARERFNFGRYNINAASYAEIESRLRVETAAIYGQANYHVTPELKLTAGLRYGNEVQEFASATYRSSSSFDRLSTVYAVDGLRDERDSLTPRLAADYQWSPNLLSYLSWTKGHKSGGFNRAAATAAIASIPVAPETVTTYEFGTKGRTSNGLLQASAAIFYNDFADYQATITNPVIDGQQIIGSVVVNAGKAHTYGLELETTVAPVKGLNWHSSLTWLRTKFDSFANPTGAAASDFTGNELPQAPRWSYGSDLDYVLPLDVPGELSVNAAIDYRSATFNDTANRSAVKNDRQTYVNLGVTYRSADEHWTVAVLAKNLFNKAYIVGPYLLSPALATNAATFSPPRLVTGSIRYGF
jgi:iron complex outermembrane receptor protein